MLCIQVQYIFVGCVQCHDVVFPFFCFLSGGETEIEIVTEIVRGIGIVIAIEIVTEIVTGTETVIVIGIMTGVKEAGTGEDAEVMMKTTAMVVVRPLGMGEGQQLHHHHLLLKH